MGSRGLCRVLAGLAGFLIFVCCSQKEDVIVYRPSHHWVDRTVAVVYPRRSDFTKDRMERTAEWFSEIFHEAQLFGDTCIRLHFRWYDELSGDVSALSRQLSRDSSIVAIVGPFNSVSLEVFAQECQAVEKPLIAPTATSEEVIRRYAVSSRTGNSDEHPFLWSLTETDVAFSEVLLAAWATQIRQLYPDITPTGSVFSPDNIYGKTFFDWVPFQAENLDIRIMDNEQYTSNDDLLRRIGRMLEEQDMLSTPSSSFCVMEHLPQFCAVASARREHYMKLAGITSDSGSPDYDSYTFAAEAYHRTWYAFSDFGQEDLDALSPGVLRDLNYSQGFMPYADPTTGFEMSYERRFGVKPTFEECKFFDGLMLAAFACYTLGESVADNRQFNQTIYELTLPNGGENLSASVWSPTAMQLFLRSLVSGVPVKFRGAAGSISFDPETSTPSAGTTYAHWRIMDGKLQILNYFSSTGNHRSSVASSAWNYLYDEAETLRRLAGQAEDKEVGITYPALTDQYAVLVHASSSFSNYRHLADVLNIYQHLRLGGFDDEHIILIADRSVADSPKNPEPGVVRTSPGGPDLMQGVQIDYDASTLTSSDVARILAGLPSGAGHNVMLFWSGHGHSVDDGGADELVWRNRPSGEGFTYELLRQTVLQMQRESAFRKLLIVVEACYAEAVVKAVEGIPGVLGMTGANASEQSWADNWNKAGNFWMCDRFSSNLATAVKANPDITYRDLYLYCAQHTLGSHACLINAANFGNLYQNGPVEFVKKEHSRL